MESWVSIGEKEGHTNIRISAKAGSNQEPCGRKAEILPTAPTMPTQEYNLGGQNRMKENGSICYQHQWIIFIDLQDNDNSNNHTNDFI